MIPYLPNGLIGGLGVGSAIPYGGSTNDLRSFKNQQMQAVSHNQYISTKEYMAYVERLMGMKPPAPNRPKNKPKFLHIREELQNDVDEWLKDVLRIN